MKKYFMALIALSVLILFFLTHYFSQSELKARILNQEGYQLNFIENVSVKFSFQDEWLSLRVGEKREVNQLIYNQNDTEISIDHVFLQPENKLLNIILKVDHNVHWQSGKVVSIDRHNPDGSVTSLGLPWKLHIKDGKEINPPEKVMSAGGQGSGSYDNYQWLNIALEFEKISEMTPLEIETPPLYVYQYARK